MSRRILLQATSVGVFVLASTVWLSHALGSNCVKVDLPHSLFGATTVPDKTIKDVAVMTLNETPTTIGT
jgi:hypothetical protein